MRHHRTNLFKTSHWGDFWRSNIPDVASLQAYNPQAAFVAIDIEPWGVKSEVAAEIAIALIRHRPVCDERNLGPPTRIEDIPASFDVHVHNIRVVGRKQCNSRREGFTPHEMGMTGELHYLEPEDVEPKLEQILKHFKTSIAADLAPSASGAVTVVDLVLIGFALEMEFKILAAHYSNLFKHFMSWVDTQELVRELTTGQPPHFKANMHDTLLALGFEDKPRLVTDVNIRHNAGNDTVRVAAVLASLLLLPPGTELTVNPTKNTRWSEQRAQKFYKLNNLHRNRPTPYEKYPFTARVQLERPVAGMTPKTFWSYFKAWNPTAVGKHSKEPAAWVCLSNLAELEAFIQQVDGTDSGTAGGEWAAVSHYDDGTVPGSVKTADQLAEHLAKLQIARIAEKKEQRARKKVQLENDDGVIPQTETWAAALSDSDKENVYE